MLPLCHYTTSLAPTLMKRLFSPSTLFICVLGLLASAPSLKAEAISLSSSATGTNLTGTVTFGIKAAPDINLLSVTFKVGDVNIHTSTTAPFTCQLNTRVLWGPYKVQAIANDASGNTWTSTESFRVSQSINGPKYKSNTAQSVAENILLFQRDNGGWPKNVDMETRLSSVDKALVLADKSRSDTTTIDNEATWGQIEFLAKTNLAHSDPRYKSAIERGISYLLEAQYPSGGWPQFYPKRYYLDQTGYSSGITFNDDAMIGTLRLLQKVAHREGAFSFVGSDLAHQAQEAVDKGLKNILDTRLPSADGKQHTVWAQQYDQTTLKPIKARPFEPAAASSYESTDIIRFLLSIPNPSEQVISAVDESVEWLKSVAITGKEWDSKSGRLTDNPHARPLWSRFYEIGTDRPIFGKDRQSGEVAYDISDVASNLRTTYTWFHQHPELLIQNEYPAWKAKMAAKTP